MLIIRSKRKGRRSGVRHIQRQNSLVEEWFIVLFKHLLVYVIPISTMVLIGLILKVLGFDVNADSLMYVADVMITVLIFIIFISVFWKSK